VNNDQRDSKSDALLGCNEIGGAVSRLRELLRNAESYRKQALVQAFGRVLINKKMTDALSRWKGNYGIYVSKTRNGLAQEIGDWCEFGCEYGPVVACTAKHLKTALRFALVETRLRAAAEGDHEIDTHTVAAELGRFRDSLNHLMRIKRKVGDIRQIMDILPAIETEADQMRNEMQDSLGKVEGLLHEINRSNS